MELAIKKGAKEMIKHALDYLYSSAKTQADFYVLGAKSAMFFEKEWTRLKALVNSDQQLSAKELCELSVLQNFFFNETAFVPATGNDEQDKRHLEAFKAGRLDLLNGFIAVKAQDDYYVDQNDTLNDVDMSEYDDYYVDLNDTLNDVDMSEYDYYVDLNDSFQ